MSNKGANRLLLALLTLSVGVNSVLWSDRREAPVAPAASPAADSADSAAGWLAAPAEGPGASGSATEAAAKLALLRSLEDQHLRDARELSNAYWTADGEYQAAYTAAMAEGLDRIRAALLDRYGSAARSDPSFRALFRPLDPLYGFLTSDQQLGIQALKRERDLALQAAARSSSRVAGGPAQAAGMQVADAAARAIVEKYQAGLAALLDADSLFEFELRDSATAEQLRASGIDFTEAEFREVYALVAGLQNATIGIDERIAQRDRLREVLGNQRFARFWASRDPTFAAVAEIARKNQLPDSTALSVYELMNDFQNRRMQLASTAERDPGRAAQDALALTAEERDAIARLVGAEIADEIVRGRALQSYRLFGGSSRPQPAFDRQESQGG